MPIKRADLDLIDWFYRLPDNHEIFNVTHKRQSIAAVIENLASETQKIRSARREIGQNGAPSVREAKPMRSSSFESDAVPERWHAIVKELYGEQATLPPRKQDISPSVRQEIEEFVKNESKP
jgi:hypothetical protein